MLDREDLLKELRGLAEVHSLTPFVKERIATLYEAIIGHPFVRTSCSNCWHDAVLIMYNHLKQGREMSKTKEFILKRGVVIQNFGESKFYTSMTLTDEEARKYLQAHPNDKYLFEKVGNIDVAAPVEEVETPVEIVVEQTVEDVAVETPQIKRNNNKRRR